ncbi:molybdopterin molybdotransferase MoeA [Actinocorallia sp. A-T 12471]|uniref:molybdopterin molybdotransferase MoeA n=1 Tax=Actinocorallia sp. A-T 12471 TaxID=3089813 RepID=UPI0029CF50E5|nr:molybdopterin molybdotransferase MoeA [Actinocorallia sp. A-T 12471]MDX6740666.1 molybdopterin molybdotransferase MoeA [Actinocorallia sp. A-T 12471]
MTVEPGTRRDVVWGRARELAHAAADPLAVEVLELGRAAGRGLAADLVCATALPAFDTAAMDGFAVSGSGPWVVSGCARPGLPWAGARLESGCAVEISTGSVVPPGAGAVLPVEAAVLVGGRVTGPALPEGKHIRRAGEDASAGACLAPAGTPVGPALLGLAAACGYDALPVRRLPRVRAVVTGDELVGHGMPGPGRIRDALSPLLPSLIENLGGGLDELVHVPDRPENALADALSARADVFVVTGSTSVGVTDGLRRLLTARDAHWIVDAVACRPGHPQLLARLPDGAHVVGLPGNPFAALVAAHTLLGPLLAGLSGRPLPRLPYAPLSTPVPVPAGRTRLVPVVWDGPAVRPLGGDRPAFLNGAALADALAAIPPGTAPHHPIPLLPLHE